MRNMDEKVRQLTRVLRFEGQSEDAIRAAVSELHRQDAVQAIGGSKVGTTSAKPAGSPWDVLQGTAVQLKLDAAATLDRYNQLRFLVRETFEAIAETSEPVNGWAPRVRRDVYGRTLDTCYRLAKEGGVRYTRAVESVRYALTGSRSYREALETLGL